MKKLIHFLWLSAALVWFTGCQKEYPKTSIDYYITANQSEEYSLLRFLFLRPKARADDGDRAVYLDPSMLTFDTAPGSLSDTIYLGQSDIEPGAIKSYILWVTGGRAVWRGNDITLLDKEYYEYDIAPADFTIQEGETKKVLFVVQVDSSIIMLPDRTFKLRPKIAVVAE